MNSHASLCRQVFRRDEAPQWMRDDRYGREWGGYRMSRRDHHGHHGHGGIIRVGDEYDNRHHNHRHSSSRV